MKKEYLMFAFIALAMLTACSNDDAVTDTEQTSWNGEIKLRSEISATRATYGQDTQILRDQKLCLWVDDSNYPNQISGWPANTARELYGCVHMTSDGNGGFNNFTDNVYYPVTANRVDLYSLNANPDTSTAVNKSYAAKFKDGAPFPSTFVQLTDSLQNTQARYAKNDLLFAAVMRKQRDSNPAALTYQHLLSKIVVVTGSSFALTDCRILGVRNKGRVTIDRQFGADPAVSITPSDDMSTSDIIMGLETDGVEAVIIPQTIAAGTAFLQFKVAAGGTFTYSLPSTMTFQSGQKYVFRVTFQQTTPMITCTVTDWTTNSEIDWE